MGQQKIIPIDKSIKPFIEKFLLSPDFQENFVQQAKKLGYKGNDPDKIKIALFTPDETGQICFANNEIYELFIDFQILEQLYILGLATTVTDDETKASLIADCRDLLEEIHLQETL
jgi:hypothetical protein